jgi:hypothetical protein
VINKVLSCMPAEISVAEMELLHCSVGIPAKLANYCQPFTSDRVQDMLL